MAKNKFHFKLLLYLATIDLFFVASSSKYFIVSSHLKITFFSASYILAHNSIRTMNTLVFYLQFIKFN